MEEEVRQMQQTIQDMERSCDLLYAPYEPDPNNSPVCRNLTQKQGYLHIRKYDIFTYFCWIDLFWWRTSLSIISQKKIINARSLLILSSCVCFSVRRGWCRQPGSVSIFSHKGVISCSRDVARWREAWSLTWTTVLSWRLTVTTDAFASRSHPLMARSECFPLDLSFE